MREFKPVPDGKEVRRDVRRRRRRRWVLQQPIYGKK
jgi:hypothetical protein